MAKKITILENAVEKSVSKVAKIKTKLANGRDCYWVPEEDYPLGVLNVTKDGVYNASSDPNGPFYGYSEVNVEGVGNVEMGTLGTITITANGTYEAATDSQGPFYGYSTVIVNVSDEDAAPDHISGKDPDGNDEVVSVDDDGNLVRETVPSSIKIISPPDILTYYDGELIDFHGIYVKGYLEDGTEWGVVPNNELSFPEPIAEYSGDADPFPSWTKTLDGKTVEVASSMKFSQYWHYSGSNWPLNRSTVDTCEDDCVIIHCNSDYRAVSYDNSSVIHFQNGTDGLYKYKENERGISGNNRFTTLLGNGKITNRPIYRAYVEGNGYSSDGAWKVTVEPELRDANMDILIAADIALSGDGEKPGSTQTIPVQWHRPGDGKSLYDNFEITVSKPDDSGGQDPQPAPTPSPD